MIELKMFELIVLFGMLFSEVFFGFVLVLKKLEEMDGGSE